jgi:CRISPR-associated endonuclease Csn1
MLRLGLDVGTNSIGWCLIEDHERIVDIGVRIFSDGRDPKTGASLAVDRRHARGMRRRRDRYLGRRSAFLRTLVAHKLMPADAIESKLVADLDPYTLRARALHERLDQYEIGRALFHLNQRRGFKSNRKADKDPKAGEDGKIASGASALDEAMTKAGADTLGQFLADRPIRRVRLDSENQAYDFYPQRRHIEYEFDQIWKAQAKHHAALLTESARADLHRILFFQRPLKQQEVGYCTFAGMNGVSPNERRLPKAHPLFQQRRLYEEVNQLRIVSPGAPDRLLTRDERDILVRKLGDKKKVSFGTLAKVIKLRPGERFNKESENRKEMIGDEVLAELADKRRFGTRWLHFGSDEQLRIIERLQEEEDAETLTDWLRSNYALEDEIAEAVSSARLPQGYGRFGETATRRLLEALKEDVITYDKAAKAGGFHHSDHRTGEVLERLPYYGEILTREIAPGKDEYRDPLERRWGKITNPTVHIGMRQLQKLVNTIIAVHGRPDQIVVELARELKSSEREKEAHKKRVKRDTDAAIARSLKLRSEGFADTGANRLLLRLWEELNPSDSHDRRCPYCGELIAIRQLFSGEADVDHIIPYSRSLDDSVGNKVVAHRSCNRAKGNKTPWERWGNDEGRWEIVSAHVARLQKSQHWRFGPDALTRLERDGGFLTRQLTDTQYISRLAGKYLRSLYPTARDGRVDVIPGRMTAMLRRLWGLNSLLPDHNYVENEHSSAPKNRLDHRHHAIDAAIAAVMTLGLMQEIAQSAARAEDKDIGRLFEDLPKPWEGFREELGEKLARVTVSHKPDHGRKGRAPRSGDVTTGRLHNDTAYGFTGELAHDGKTPLVVHRVPLMSLKPADLADPSRIPDRTLRDALQASTRGLLGRDLEQALARFAKEHPVFAGIRRVRVREPLNVVAVRDQNGRAYKGYKGDSNSRYDVWRLPNGKWTYDVVSTFDAHQPSSAERRPHPAAKKMLSLRQNDLMAVERDGGPPELLRVVKFSSSGTLVLAGVNEAGALKARDAASADTDPFRYVYATGGSLKKMKARQVRLDLLGRVFDPGSLE